MKNIMKHAWEIAREGQKRFGGKVVEYLSESLKIAWAATKKNNIDYTEICRKNNCLVFTTNNIEELEVNFLSEDVNIRGERYTKRNHLEHQVVKNNVTGQIVRLYSIEIGAGDIEIRLGDKIEVIENSIDFEEWGIA